MDLDPGTVFQIFKIPTVPLEGVRIYSPSGGS
jgi:hypothetical protein